MSKFTDISIDLETLGTRFDSAILSIGACAFNRKTGAIGSTYYAELLPDEALRTGIVTGSTLAWWMQQSDEARRLFGTGGADKRLAFEALQGLSDFVRSFHAPCVWGNGATFDITILEHAYSTAGCALLPAWHYRNIRDMRTIVDVAGFDPNSIKFAGTPHNAKDDAVHQAKVIAACFRKLDSALTLLEKQKKRTPKPTYDEDDEL